MLFAYAFGVAPGLITGVAYGVVDFLQSSSPITNVWSFALDYLVGYGVICLAGLFRRRDSKWGLYAGIVIASAARFTASVLSGVMFYASYAEGTGLSPFWYSVGYNGSYMLPDMLICCVLALMIGPRVLKEMKRT